MSTIASLNSFISEASTGTPSSQPSQPSQPSSPLQFSIIEIDGNLYYLGSMHMDECILNYSHTMPTTLLDTLVKYATGLSNEKITTIVFKHFDDDHHPSHEKKVVGFWHPQLSKFVLNTHVHAGVGVDGRLEKDVEQSPE